MAHRTSRDLDAGYTVEADAIDETAWCEAIGAFDDVNIYQTWAYGAVTSGERNVSHVVLRKNGAIAALAQARLARLPLLSAGVAYVRWGPLWRRDGADDVTVFRQAIRALRNEYVCKRGLTLRLFPLLFENASSSFRVTLAEEGFALSGPESGNRTILMDLGPSIEELHDGMKRNWKRNLRAAEQNSVEVVEGCEDRLFESFIALYDDMVARKNFVRPNDINAFRAMQARLPSHLKMKIMLGKAGDKVCAGLIWSDIGAMAVELFAATSDMGLTNKASYLLRWRLVEKLKANNHSLYDLNGVNPVRNPGGYKFKSELAGRHGRELCFLGQFDSQGGVVSSFCLQGGELLRSGYRALKTHFHTGRTGKLRPDPAR
jgi:hypothetical protein